MLRDIEHDIKDIISKYSKYINSGNILGYGTQVYCFKYNNKKVLKICSKKISFFNNFTNPFNVINNMYPFFLKIKPFYANDKIFIYKQKKCIQLKKSNIINKIHNYFILSVVLTIIFMINEGKIVTDIGIHNWGILKDNISIFDWHGIKNINNSHDSRLLYNLDKYLRPYGINNILNYMNYDSLRDELVKNYHTIYSKYESKLKNNHKKILNYKMTRCGIV